MRIYISGAISSDPNYLAKFEKAEMDLRLQGYEVINPAKIMQNLLFLSYDEMMTICIVLVGKSDKIYMLSDWSISNGATRELATARILGIERIFENARPSVSMIDGHIDE